MLSVSARAAGARASGAPPAGGHLRAYAGAVHLSLVAIVVNDYDPAIGFFVGSLGFELVEDSPCG